MVATWKAKSKIEETQDWLRTKATVATQPVEGMAKLKQQITQLMAILTQLGLGGSNTSALNSPQGA